MAIPYSDMPPAMDLPQFESRKRDHLRHALDPAHQASGLGGFDRVHLVHEALPELDFDEIRLDTPCLGRGLATPFYIAGMTAGHADAPALNRTLALACANRGWALGVGSQRRELETGIDGQDRWAELRAEVPELFLIANIGLSQLISSDVDRVLVLAERLKADAIAVHANSLQEAIQPEGTPRFRGGLAALARLSRASKSPVILKETGCGFSDATLRRVAHLGLGAVDVSGLGGTHWGRIEGARAGESSLESHRERATTARLFAEWGEPTAESVRAAKSCLAGAGTPEIWASGGIRTGLDAAKAIALGARRIGFAKPALEAALGGQEALESWMRGREHELRVALFCTGSASPGALGEKTGSWKQI